MHDGMCVWLMMVCMMHDGRCVWCMMAGVCVCARDGMCVCDARWGVCVCDVWWCPYVYVRACMSMCACARACGRGVGGGKEYYILNRKPIILVEVQNT